MTRRAALGLTAAAVLLAGCGSTSTSGSAAARNAPAANRLSSHVSLRTRAGFRYTAELAGAGGQACLDQSFELLGPHVAAYQHLIRSCGKGADRGPLLIQATRPRIAVILDRPAAGCAAVRAGGRRASTVCSTGKPTLRLTELPVHGRSLPIDGISGVARVDLRIPHGCKHVCERLAAG